MNAPAKAGLPALPLKDPKLFREQCYIDGEWVGAHGGKTFPVDNPATHLELTMIHEAMLLEYAGPDLALVEWASAVKELLYITLLIDLFMPTGIATLVAPVPLLVAAAAWAGKVLVFAVAITLVESTNAKLRLFRVPELVAVSLGLGFLALAIRFL